MKNNVPWYVKIIIKIVISKLKINKSFLHKFGIFRHGSMDSVEYSDIVFQRHFKNFKPKSKKYKILELGPGNSITTGIYAFASGCQKTYLVDSGDFITRDMDFYKKVIGMVFKNKTNSSDIKDINNFESLKNKMNIQYDTNGLQSLNQIPDNSVDFIFSNAVLEHVKKDEFFETIKELFRILKNDGISSHEIDLKDHLGYSLNNLRFYSKVWESATFQQSGFYTNRIRYNEMLEIFKSVGFKVKVIKKWYWDELPINKKKLTHQYKSINNGELKINCFDVILKKILNNQHMNTDKTVERLYPK